MFSLYWWQTTEDLMKTSIADIIVADIIHMINVYTKLMYLHRRSLLHDSYWEIKFMWCKNAIGVQNICYYIQSLWAIWEKILIIVFMNSV